MIVDIKNALAQLKRTNDMHMKGKTDAGGIVIGAIVVVAILSFAGVIDLSELGSAIPSGGAGGGAAGSDDFLQGLDTLTYRVASSNPLNQSGQYVAGSINFDAGSDGSVQGTATANAVAGTAVNFASLTVSASSANLRGTMYAVPAATLNSGKVSVDGTVSREVTVTQTIGDEARAQLLNLAKTNITQEDIEDPSEASATAMSTGDTRSGYIRIRSGNELLSVYGSENELGHGTLWIVDVVDSAAFTDNAMTLQAEGWPLTGLPCSTYAKSAAVYAGDRCYVGPAIKPSHGFIDVKHTLSNDGGTNAGATSDPTVDILDLQYFVDTDQRVSFEATDKGGGDVGQGTSTITMDNS